MKYYKKGNWHKLGKVGSDIFAVKDGLVCMDVPAETAVVGGVNSLGYQWYALEYTDEAMVVGDDIPDAQGYEQMDEPYLKEWGWQCCLREAAKGDDVAMDLYRWLYRCMKQRFSIVSRTIVIVGKDGVKRTYSCATDGGDVPNKDSYGEFGGGRYLNIPLVQFPNLSESYLRNMAYRVKEDNPELFYTLWPQVGLPAEKYEGDLYGMGTDGGYAYLYSAEPTQEQAADMMATVDAAVVQIKQRLESAYGIFAGQTLSVAQKVTVSKVIHDYIVTVGRNGDETGDGLYKVDYLLNTMYAVFEPKLAARCGGYAQAFNYVARLYGIESLYMSGTAYIDKDVDGSLDLSGGHAWSMLRLSNEPYGTYPHEASKWSCIDVYWDEPVHEAEFGGTPARDDVIWDYFLNINNIFPQPDSDRYQRAHRSIDTRSGYGVYPTALLSGMDAQPKLHMPYNGETNEFGGTT